MDRTEIKRWAQMFHAFLVIERGGTVDDVFTAANAWLSESRFFPTIADLAPLVETLVQVRREGEQLASAQQAAVPVRALPADDLDYANTPTRDLPPGYDFSEDPHWQRGVELLQAVISGRAPADSFTAFVAGLDLRRRSFQGAGKPRDVVCPTCQGARWLRGDGWDAPKVEMGRRESTYLRCPTCCPGGIYDEAAEREAARAAAMRAADIHP